MRIEGQDVEVSPAVYARLVAEAVDARLRVMLADVPAGVVLLAPEAVVESIVSFVVSERARLSR